MSELQETQENSGVRFPFINLEKALGRAKELFDADTKGREMSIGAAFGVWKYSEKSSGGFQTIGALKMYGLIKDSGAGKGRKLALTDTALRYFRDEREDEKQKLAQEFALKPKLIATLWVDWGTNPPTDTVARSHLKADRGLNDQASRSLLSVYKENVAFTNIKGDAKVGGNEDEAEEETPAAASAANPPAAAAPIPPLPPISTAIGAKIMQGERELTAGLLSKDAGFRLIVNGVIGVKEIERLIMKLQFDKDILAEVDPPSEG